MRACKENQLQVFKPMKITTSDFGKFAPKQTKS
jgi:hypothetical protein